MRHGRAVMPFGKHRGIPVRLLPDDYLGWLATRDLDLWKWLRESIAAELRFRGFRDDRAGPEEPAEPGQPAPVQLELKPKRPTRRFKLTE